MSSSETSGINGIPGCLKKPVSTIAALLTIPALWFFPCLANDGGRYIDGDRKAWQRSCLIIDAGRSWMRSGKIQKAIKCYSEAARVYPSSYMAYFQLGSAERTRSDMDKAETCFKKALSIEPKLVEAMVSMADVLTMRKKYREAESYIRKALAINPKSFDYNWTLGDILCRAGKYEESYEIYKKICAKPEAEKVKGEMDAWHEELLEHVQPDPKPKVKI